MKTEHGQRLVSLDLLKILCMLMIISLHFISHGGLSDYFVDSPIMQSFVSLLRSLSICSVNVFVLISGYLMVDKVNLNFKRLASIALAVWFYAWLYFAITYPLNSSAYGIKEILKSLLPISYKLYWFPSCYLCLCLLSPFLNKLLHNLSLKMASFFLGMLFVLLSVWNDIAVMSDPFGISNGYSVGWFIFLYCLAGFIKLHGEHFFKRLQRCHWGWIYLGSALLIFAVDIILSVMSDHIAAIERYDLVHHFSRYCSILVIVESVALFMFFRSAEIKNSTIGKLCNFVAPLTFGVYLIHDNANIRQFLYFKILGLDSLPNGLLALPIILGYLVALFVFCCFVEFLRKKIFGILEHAKWYQNFCSKVQARIDIMLAG